MTLWTEYNRQQKMHETTAAKAAKLAEEKKIKAEAKAQALKAKEVLAVQEESKIEALKAKAPKKAAAKKFSKKTK